MQKRTAVVFDLDGTLLNTLTDIAASVNAALAAFGKPACTKEQVRRYVGNGLRRTLELAFPGGGSAAEFDAAFQYLLAHYAEHCLDSSAPYPGIPELLSELAGSGYALAVVSNKADFAVQQLRERFFAQIGVAVGERSGVARKPAPDMVTAALKELGVDTAAAVYVGDSEVDIATARNAGLPCVSVLWGFRSRAQLTAAGAAHFAEQPQNLPALLASF